MKNNGGWGLRAELWICLVISVFFAIAVVLINRVVNFMNDEIYNSESKEEIEVPVNKEDNTIDESTKNDNENSFVSFNNLEDKLVKAGVLYAGKYYNNDTLIVTVVRLQTENMLDKLMINDTMCSGYIEIKKDNEFKYYPYIKCGDLYETDGYKQSLDNVDL